MNAELLKHIELLIGSVGVILGIFFSIFLFSFRRDQPKANIFLSIYLLAFSLRIGKSLFHNFFEVDPTLRTFFLTTLLCIGPSLWLYTQNLLWPKNDKQLNVYFHFIPFFILLSTSWLIPNNGSNISIIFHDLLVAHMFGYTFFSLVWLRRSMYINAIQENSRITSWLTYFLLVNLGIIVIYFLISKSIIPFYLGLSFLFSSVIVFFSFWALKNPFLFKVPKEKYKRSTIACAEAAQLITELKIIMNNERPYLNPKLTLTELSAKLNVSTKELSQAINQIESLNYSQFVSRYRIEEVKRLLKSNSHSKFTIAAIAYDSGFSSISSFNTTFKKHTGLTAINFRAAAEAP